MEKKSQTKILKYRLERRLGQKIELTMSLTEKKNSVQNLSRVFGFRAIERKKNKNENIKIEKKT